MKTATSWCLVILCGLGFAHRVAAQNLDISDARVIVGNGDVIDRGTIVIRSGRIASVSEDPVVDPEFPVLDAEGLTVMPGFTDGHRQVIQGDPDEWMEQAADRMREHVEAGRSNAEYGLVMKSTLGAPTVADRNSTGPANARLLWDAGVIYGYGTDTALLPRDALRHELTLLKLVFSNEEIVDILTKSAPIEWCAQATTQQA